MYCTCTHLLDVHLEILYEAAASFASMVATPMGGIQEFAGNMFDAVVVSH